MKNLYVVRTNKVDKEISKHLNKKEKILLYGAGAVARDIINLNKLEEQFDILGFIDDFSIQKEIYGLPIYSSEEIKNFFKEINLIITIGDPKIKEKIFYKISKILKTNLKNYISKSATILSSNIGQGVIVYPYSLISSDCIIKDNVLICGNVSIGHDCIINSFSTIVFNSSIGGNTIIGKKTYIGSGVSIKDELKIGENNIVGLGSIVTKNIENNTLFYNKKIDFLAENNKEGVF